MPLQDWGPIPAIQELVYDWEGTLTTSAVNVPFVIKDIIGTDLAIDAVGIRLKSKTYYKYPMVEWVNPVSYNSNGYPTENYYDVIPYTNGMSFDFLPTFQNRTSLPNGYHYFYHSFVIEVLLTSGNWVERATYLHTLKLQVINAESNDDPVNFNPENLTFFHRQNETLPTMGVLIFGLLWEIVGKPNFVLSSETPGVTITNYGTGEELYQKASGSVTAFVDITLGSFYDNDINFEEEDLEGTFEVLENAEPLGEINWNVQLNRLADFLINPYPENDKAFTLDTKYFELFSSNLNTYFQFDAEIKTYDFLTNQENLNYVPQKIVLFQEKAKINLGKLIHRLMSKFIEPNEELLQYREATLKIICSEKTIADGTVLRTAVSKEIPFVAGLSKGITNFGFLDFNPLPNRVTINSFAYLNILIQEENYELRCFKNGSLIGTPVALPEYSGIILCKKVTFGEFTQGDTIQFVLDVVGEENEDAPRKTFVVFPEGDYSNQIVWENEFLLQSAIECTGTASIIPEGEFQSQTIYENLVEKLEHLSSSKNVKLSINTGWLMYSDIDTVESLMRSKRVWLIQGEKNISLRPISKKFPEKNLEEELIQFPMEFKINPNYDEETYTL